ncbi:MAG: hypothetical protein AAF466_12485 [Bacteroidota bacterium]
MALLLRGKSKCPICGEIIHQEAVVAGYLSVSAEHPMFRFHDVCMHQSCYEQWELRETYEKLVAK